MLGATNWLSICHWSTKPHQVICKPNFILRLNAHISINVKRGQEANDSRVRSHDNYKEQSKLWSLSCSVSPFRHSLKTFLPFFASFTYALPTPIYFMKNYKNLKLYKKFIFMIFAIFNIFFFKDENTSICWLLIEACFRWMLNKWTLVWQVRIDTHNLLMYRKRNKLHYTWNEFLTTSCAHHSGEIQPILLFSFSLRFL